MRVFASFCLALLTGIAPISAIAQSRETIGMGRLFNNDFLGDGGDRWRTGSYVLSIVRGRQGYDGMPQNPGDIIEYRLRAEIIAPERGSRAPGDRPYVGALSLGAHTHFGYGGFDLSVGGDVVAVGQQTGLSGFQEAYHDVFSLPKVPYTNGQVDDEFYLSGSVAISRPVHLSDTITLRPFAEATAGVEDLVRVGGDVLIGNYGHDDLQLRDVVTGQLYRATTSAGTGFAYVVGADIAAVSSSVYLPTDRGYDVVEQRTRARAGVHWQMDPDVSFFYGVTYLGEEFSGQPESQLVGSLKLNFNF